jgi:hypothetical protein
MAALPTSPPQGPVHHPLPRHRPVLGQLDLDHLVLMVFRRMLGFGLMTARSAVLLIGPPFVDVAQTWKGWNSSIPGDRIE